jgi:hypothetical protein
MVRTITLGHSSELSPWKSQLYNRKQHVGLSVISFVLLMARIENLRAVDGRA